MAKRVLYYLRSKGNASCAPYVVAQYADRSCRTWSEGERGYRAAWVRAGREVARKRAEGGK